MYMYFTILVSEINLRFMIRLNEMCNVNRIAIEVLDLIVVLELIDFRIDRIRRNTVFEMKAQKKLISSYLNL